MNTKKQTTTTTTTKNADNSTTDKKTAEKETAPDPGSTPEKGNVGNQNARFIDDRLGEDLVSELRALQKDGKTSPRTAMAWCTERGVNLDGLDRYDFADWFRIGGESNDDEGDPVVDDKEAIAEAAKELAEKKAEEAEKKT